MSRRIAVAVAVLAPACAALAGASPAGADPVPVTGPGCHELSYDEDATRRYLEWVASATPEELIATFGR